MVVIVGNTLYSQLFCVKPFQPVAFIRSMASVRRMDGRSDDTGLDGRDDDHSDAKCQTEPNEKSEKRDGGSDDGSDGSVDDHLNAKGQTKPNENSEKHSPK